MKKNKLLLSITLCLVAFASMFTMFIPKTKVSAEIVDDSYSTANVSMDIPFYLVKARITNSDHGYSSSVFQLYNSVLGSSDDRYLLRENDELVNIVETYIDSSGYFVYVDMSPLNYGQYDIATGWVEFMATDFVFQRNFFTSYQDKFCLFIFQPNNVEYTSTAQWYYSITYTDYSGIQNKITYGYINENQFYLEDLLLSKTDICYIQELSIRLLLNETFIENTGINWRIAFNCTADASTLLAQFRSKYIKPAEVIYEVNWFESIISSVNDFMSIEILPEISFYDILIIGIAIPLLIMILRIWLGG